MPLRPAGAVAYRNDSHSICKSFTGLALYDMPRRRFFAGVFPKTAPPNPPPASPFPRSQTNSFTVTPAVANSPAIAPAPPRDGTPVRFDADALICPVQGLIAPASVIMRTLPVGGSQDGGSPSVANCEILASGSPCEVDAHALRLGLGSARTSLPGRVLLPRTVNAHTHLDLTHIGPLPAAADGFVGFANLVRSQRHSEPEAIARSVRAGITLLEKSGTLAAGDIAGFVPDVDIASAASEPLLEAMPGSLSFLEYFALTESAANLLPTRFASLVSQNRIGLQPHALYSVGKAGYQFAFGQRDRHVATHLAETLAESQLSMHARGPLRDFLQSMNLWTEQTAALFGSRCSPVDRVLAQYGAPLRAATAARTPDLLCVHLNFVSDADIAVLAQHACTVVYCPRSSAYFLAERDAGPHRYRDMLAAGISVVLGTDSVINLPPSDVKRNGLSVLDEARLLIERDQLAPITAVRMCTSAAAAALGLDAQEFNLLPGRKSGLISAAAAGLLSAAAPNSSGDGGSADIALV